MSRYATFKVDPERAQTIEVTPIDEWWQFKKAQRDAGKMMSVKEAEEAMKKQENFLGPLSLANKIIGKKTLVRDRRAQGLDWRRDLVGGAVIVATCLWVDRLGASILRGARRAVTFGRWEVG